MSFRLDDIIVDRIQYGMAEDFSGTPLYMLTQLADATIEITAESKEARDAQGTLVKKFWQGKSGTFTANNAMINLNVVGAASGSGKEIASESNVIPMPKIITVKAGTTVTLADFVEGTVSVSAMATNGAMGANYKLGTEASATEFALTAEGVLTPPTDANETMYVVKYDRSVKNGVAIRNRADKFPGTVRLTLKALIVDPCSADTLRAAYIVLPSFQVSPEISLSLTTDAQLEYTGDLQVDYCSAEKTLYEVYVCADDEEE